MTREETKEDAVRDEGGSMQAVCHLFESSPLGLQRHLSDF